jgi:hypothetical protein
MRNRLELAQHFADLGFKVGAEIGVAKGFFSMVLCQTIPGLKLYGIDPYIAYPFYHDFKHQHSIDRAERIARERLAPFFPNYTFIKEMSMDAVKHFDDGSLDFVFIDGNHKYDFVLQDIRAWEPKVRSGGIVSGHDYYKFRSGKVIKAVDEYVAETGVDLYVTEWDNDNPEPDNRQPSWYFVK